MVRVGVEIDGPGGEEWVFRLFVLRGNNRMKEVLLAL